MKSAADWLNVEAVAAARSSGERPDDTVYVRVRVKDFRDAALFRELDDCVLVDCDAGLLPDADDAVESPIVGIGRKGDRHLDVEAPPGRLNDESRFLRVTDERGPVEQLVGKLRFELLPLFARLVVLLPPAARELARPGDLVAAFSRAARREGDAAS